jgi:hypothetical protein
MTGWLDSLFADAGAPEAAQYLTLALHDDLTGERLFAPNSSQFTGADGGAGASYTLSLQRVVTLTAGGACSFAVPAVTSGVGNDLALYAGDTTDTGVIGGSILMYVGSSKTGEGEDHGSFTVYEGDGQIGFRVSSTEGLGWPTVEISKELKVYGGSIGAGNIVVHVSEDTGSPAIAFFGETPIAQQTVDYYGDEDTDSGHAGTLALALLDALDALGLVSKNLLEV